MDAISMSLDEMGKTTVPSAEKDGQILEQDSSGDDEFFDAQDFFDQEILDMLNLDKNMQTQGD